MKKQKIFHFEKSKSLAELIKAKSKECFYNATIGMTYFDDPIYAYGFITGPASLHYLHAWIEVENDIIDPTVILTRKDDEVIRHFKIEEFNRDELIDYICKNDYIPPPGVNIFGEKYQKIKKAAESHGINPMTLIC